MVAIAATIAATDPKMITDTVLSAMLMHTFDILDVWKMLNAIRDYIHRHRYAIARFLDELMEYYLDVIS